VNADIPRAIALLDSLLARLETPEYTLESLRTVVTRYARHAQEVLQEDTQEAHT
jgi:hypothetical protein